MYQQLENGDVQITMRQDDYTTLLIALGFATLHPDKGVLSARTLFGLMDRLNEGNPHYRPYGFSEEPRDERP